MRQYNKQTASFNLPLNILKALEKMSIMTGRNKSYLVESALKPILELAGYLEKDPFEPIPLEHMTPKQRQKRQRFIEENMPPAAPKFETTQPKRVCTPENPAGFTDEELQEQAWNECPQRLRDQLPPDFKFNTVFPHRCPEWQALDYLAGGSALNPKDGGPIITK